MEIKKLFIMILISGVAAVMGAAAYAALGDKIDGSLPVVNTLSSEQLAEISYTSMTAMNDSDMWEDDGDHVPSVTVAVPEADTEVTVLFPLDINTASAQELMQIYGIGNVTAENIVAYRESNGYFYSVYDLLNVEGIGEKKLADMMDLICIDPEIIPQTQGEDSTPSDTVTGISDGDASVTVTVFTEERPEGSMIELNTATAEELMSINGIGQVLAERIVDYADQYGFNDVNDLLNVSGIGESRMKGIEPYVYVDKERLSRNTESNEPR